MKHFSRIFPACSTRNANPTQLHILVARLEIMVMTVSALDTQPVEICMYLISLQGISLKLQLLTAGIHYLISKGPEGEGPTAGRKACG